MDSSRKTTRVFMLASTLTTGGAEMVISYLAAGLGRFGFTPEIICLNERGDVGSSIAAAGVKVSHRISRCKLDPGAFFRLRKRFAEDSDAVMLSLDHHDAIFLGAMAARAAHLHRTALCVHSTGLWSRKGSFNLTDRIALPAYRKVVALSAAHEQFLAEHEGVERSKLVRINNGVDTSRFSPAGSEQERIAWRSELGIPPDDFVVAIVAALRPEKNHGMFIDSAARLLSEDDGWTFLIVGEGSEAGKLHEKAQNVEHSEKIRFTGRREDTEKIYALSDVSVLCSHPVVETFPLTVIEAMSCGIPVVATSVGSISEMVDEAEEGFLVDPGDDKAMAEKLRMLRADPGLRTDMGRRARERARRDFTVEHMVRGYADMFDSLMKPGKKDK